MKKHILIEGMSCDHCRRHVEEALKEVPGVGCVLVDLKEKKAVIEADDTVRDADLKNAIAEAGYDVTGIQNE